MIDKTEEQLIIEMQIEAMTMRDSDDWYRDNNISRADQEAELLNLMEKRDVWNA